MRKNDDWNYLLASAMFFIAGAIVEIMVRIFHW
jgi:hypothetical protein